jgi:ribonucleoside-diphosphate reductase beta chain
VYILSGLTEKEEKKMSKLLEPSITYKPFNYPWAMQFAESHEKIHWGSWEAKLAEDVKQWKGSEIKDNEKKHITQILRVFTQSDCAVASNYCDQFIPHFKNNEIRNMLLSFANREGTHQRAYALLNDTLGLAEEEYSTFLSFKEMKDKIEFMQSTEVSNHPSLKALGTALAQAVCNEGMSLFSAFVMLLNYQRSGKMKGMCEIVEWSIKDESMHVEAMIKLFQTFCEENPRVVNNDLKKQIYTNFTQSVALEDALVDLVYDGQEESICGLTAKEVKDYVRYLADRRLLQLGLKAQFGVESNPLPWLDWIVSGDSFKNFFEGVVTDYNADGMSGDWGWE